MAETYECFKVEVADYVATVTLARPPVNAQNRRFREEIIAIFDTLSDRTRCPRRGADRRRQDFLGRRRSQGAARPQRGARRLSAAQPHWSAEGFNAVMECEKPVIAAINGAAIGAGCVLALCCDILIASRGARYLAMTEVDVGLAGGVSHVRRFFRESDARLLIYTARRMHGPELYRMGVVSACVPADALLGDRARHRAGNRGQEPARGPRGQAIVQRHRRHAVARRLPLRAVADRGARSSEETKEAQRAFAEKRKPVFKT